MRRALLVGALLAALAGCGTTAPDAPTTVPTVTHLPVSATVQVADPVTVGIPKLSVVDDIVPVGLDANGEMALPDISRTGWFEPGPEPGEGGHPSVLVSHVNWGGKTGAFTRISELVNGDSISITDADGVVRVFEVTAKTRIKKTDYAKVTVPLVFGAVNDVEIRLVTCGGQLNGHDYDSNDVVSAKLVAS